MVSFLSWVGLGEGGSFWELRSGGKVLEPPSCLRTGQTSRPFLIEAFSEGLTPHSLPVT